MKSRVRHPIPVSKTFSLEFNEETGEWELKTVESFDSYEEAKEAYEQAKCEGKDAGIRF